SSRVPGKTLMACLLAQSDGLQPDPLQYSRCFPECQGRLRADDSEGASRDCTRSAVEMQEAAKRLGVRGIFAISSTPLGTREARGCRAPQTVRAIGPSTKLSSGLSKECHLEDPPDCEEGDGERMHQGHQS